jgi:type II secretory ATPase GspE/PulE/Tfp pilus assembly ATPase PilB-like protein
MNKKEENIVIDALLKGDYIAPEDLKKSEIAAKKKGVSVVDELLAKNILSTHLLGEAMGEYYGVRYADFSLRPPQKEFINLIPEDIARANTLAVYGKDDQKIIVATSDPLNKELGAILKKIFSKSKFETAFAWKEEIERTFVHYQKSISEQLEKFLSSGKATVPETLNTIFISAIDLRASDIHFEPHKEDVRLRFRVDGVLHVAGIIPKALFQSITNRIKILSNLRIDEHFITQDGALRFPLKNGDMVDMRISIVPTVFGETIVIRQLTKYVDSLNLLTLGLSNDQHRVITEVAKKPYGMILSVGPTGSGKTTTLYSILSLLNQPTKNITTIEDPVEYLIEGINQIQVNVKTGITFAKGLRSIVRQDPNIIMVGEIRDTETAEIAINAALTGHLLLSTFHANDAPSSIPRLLDMGIEPFLLASTLKIIVAQRLVPKICTVCKVSSANEAIFKTYPWIEQYLPEKQQTIFFHGKGCSACAFTGNLGRVGLFEILVITPVIEELMLKRPSSKELWELATTQGMKSLFQDGIEKVQSGMITIDNLLRVASPNPYIS